MGGAHPCRNDRPRETPQRAYKSVEELWALPRLTKKRFAVLLECLTVGAEKLGVEPGGARTEEP